MRVKNLLSLPMLIALIGLSVACSPQPDVPLYTYPPQGEPMMQQPGQSSNPAPPQTTTTSEEYVERYITVDEKNSIFSIGIPAGYKEKTEVIAQDYIDFWFEYLPAEAQLIVNGTEIQRNPYIWETKISYTRFITSFKYEIKNTAGKYISYNLHLLPSTTGAKIPVIVRQRWLQ